jgi:hypothetical protein
LTAHVKASGIRQDSEYWVEVDAREYATDSKGGRYKPLGTPFYQNQLGADSQGDIDSLVTIPLPPGTYPAISVEAWNGGPHGGPCGSLERSGGASLTHIVDGASSEEKVREGCVVLRLPASTVKRKPAANLLRKRVK